MTIFSPCHIFAPLSFLSLPSTVTRIGNCCCQCYSVVKLIRNCVAVLLIGLTALWTKTVCTFLPLCQLHSVTNINCIWRWKFILLLLVPIYALLKESFSRNEAYLLYIMSQVFKLGRKYQSAFVSSLQSKRMA